MFQLLALVATVISPSLATAADCENIKGAQQRLTCYDATARAKSGSLSNTEKSKNGCHTFEVASNALKISIESGVLRNDRLASGISELIAKREECRLAAKSQSENATYEQNINAFKDIYEALRVTERLCNYLNDAGVRNCAANVVPLTSRGPWGCNAFYNPIPRHRTWIEQHCDGQDNAANLISHILQKEVTVY